MEILLLLLYLMSGIVVATICRKYNWLDKDDPFTAVVILLWPFLIACFLLLVLAEAVNSLVEFLGGK